MSVPHQEPPPGLAEFAAGLAAQRAAELVAFDAEVRAERRYEAGLAIKAGVALALVAALLLAHVFLFT
jgi:hypothetical protein